ncbi:Transducin family protein / WD-40 repeat family protein [Zea mays]|uniref:Transducin family protein / WD-40 repeat family protein n=1 Tax=Zea mays TaxID=4577 RepID=A0A1D6FUD7_MAIZE|nr:Transducin family protein / WD-40 repeat family protein [Zea mays]AQK95086.1 Transducin family protein / WD-40 repeat family protein [Zea mays]
MGRTIKKAKKAQSKKSKKKTESSSSSNPAIASGPAKVWQPGVDTLEDGEELQFDPQAYNYLRGFGIGWSCLSFDVVRDQLGLVRSEFPHTFYGVAGTQAEKASWNYIGVFKLSNISGKKREPIPASAVEADTDVDSDSSSDEEDEEINEDTKPILHLKKVAHAGCVNRIRSMTQKPHISATWGDTGHVQVWDLSSFLNSLAESGTAAPKEDDIIHKHLPLKVFSGDCNKCIHLWEPTSNNWNVDANPFVGHSASVEDLQACHCTYSYVSLNVIVSTLIAICLQWSPTEADIFASCSVDGTISIWDIRTGKKPCISVKAHEADVNVISWNKYEDSLVAHFEYHKKAITSIEWSPHEASSLAVTSEDHQLTIWDLSLERDAEEEAEFRAKMKEQANAPEDLPPQLLFAHQGQRDLKELHWHPQIPSMIISTAIDGFNVLMPSNIDTTIPGSTDAAMPSAEPQH